MNAQNGPVSRLCELRRRADISVRQLARQLAIHHSNIVYWEKTGRVAKKSFYLNLLRSWASGLKNFLRERSKQDAVST